MGTDVVVVGAGVIGLAVAWRCAQRGLSVTVCDPAPGSGATGTAAGLLAPVTEMHYEGRDLLALSLASAARYPAFVAELTEVTGRPTGYRACGTVQAAWDAADLAGLRALHDFHTTLGLPAQLLTSRELREFEPALAAGLPGGLYAAGDHQVDPRLLHAALLAAVRGLGVLVAPAAVPTLALDGGVTVLAAGAWSGRVGGLPKVFADAVRPVKGQTVRLRAAPDLLTHVVRGDIKGNHVYLVPRAGGDLVVGASSEEAGFDTRPRAGAVYALLRDAQTLVPELSEAEFVEVSTSLRPGSPDNAPLLGESGVPGLVLATGHYRNGILLAPVTGDEIANLIVDGRPSPVLAPFSPLRLVGRS